MTGAGTLNSADAGTLDTPIYTLLSRARAPLLFESLKYWQGGGIGLSLIAGNHYAYWSIGLAYPL